MRQFFVVIFILGFVFAVIPLLMLVNIRLTISSPEKAKTLMANSDVYEFLGAGLRETIVKAANTSVESGQFFEILNESLDNATLKKVTEDSIDQVFAIANNAKAEPKITIKMSMVEDRIRQVINEKNFGGDIKLLDKNGEVASTLAETPFGGDQVYTIDQFPLAGSLVRFTQGLIISAVSAIVLLIMIFFVSSGSTGARFKWLGGTFFFLGVSMLGLVLINFFLIPAKIDSIVDIFKLRDPRFIAGATKFVTNLNATQKIPLLIETVVSFIVGIIFVVIGSTFHQEKVEVAPTSPAPVKK
jgi:hypothetical protein